MIVILLASLVGGLILGFGGGYGVLSPQLEDSKAQQRDSLDQISILEASIAEQERTSQMQLQSFESEKLGLQQKIELKDSMVTSLQGEEKSFEIQVTRFQEQLSDSQTALVANAEELQVLTTKSENLQQEIVDKATAIGQLAEQKLVLESQLNSLSVQRDEARSEKEDLEVRLAEIQIQLSARDQEGKDLKAQVTELQAKLNDEDSTLHAEIDELEEKISDQKAQVAMFTSERDGLQSQVDSLTSELNDLKEDHTQLVSDYDDLVEDYNSLLIVHSNVLQDYNAVKTKWDLWESHSDFSPQSREEYDYFGFIPSPGAYSIDRTSFFVSFPDPENCLFNSSVIATGSMKPALDAGHTTISTTCFEETDLRPGDIIVYRDSSFGLILHQIIQVNSDGVIAKGIHNEEADPGTVKWEDIAYLVVAVIY